MKLIVGLGNPGPTYERTRHNIGFMTVDAVAKQLGLTLNQHKFKANFGVTVFKNEKVMLIKPLTFMNRSGESVREVLDYYKLPVDHLIVVYDDLDLSCGQIKLRMKGGSGGHNGVKSVIEHLSTKEFKRIRMGIGRPERGDVVSYVLNPFDKKEADQVRLMIDRAAAACLDFVEQPFEKVMNMYNSS